MDIELLNVDEEFSSLLPPLTKEQISELEQLIDQHGWNEPLFYWEGKGVLIDGHHRYRIWHRDYRGSKLPGPKLVGLHFETRAEVMEWMVAHQRSRRNWTREERDEAIRKMYREVSQEHGGNRKNQKKRAQTSGKSAKKSSYHNDNLIDEKPPKAAEKVADAFGVSPSTVNRAVASGKAKSAKKETDKLIEEAGTPASKDLKRAGEFSAIAKKLQTLLNEIKSLSEDRCGSLLKVSEAERDIGNVKRMVKFAAPHNICPYCKDKKPDNCKACKSLGWVNQLTWKSAPEDKRLTVEGGQK